LPVRIDHSSVWSRMHAYSSAPVISRKAFQQPRREDPVTVLGVGYLALVAGGQHKRGRAPRRAGHDDQRTARRLAGMARVEDKDLPARLACLYALPKPGDGKAGALVPAINGHQVGLSADRQTVAGEEDQKRVPLPRQVAELLEPVEKVRIAGLELPWPLPVGHQADPQRVKPGALHQHPGEFLGVLTAALELAQVLVLIDADHERVAPRLGIQWSRLDGVQTHKESCRPEAEIPSAPHSPSPKAPTVTRAHSIRPSPVCPFAVS